MEAERLRVVIAHSERMSAKLLNFVLGDVGHEVELATGMADALKRTLGQETDAVLLGSEFADGDGYTLCKELRARRFSGPIIFVSSKGEIAAKVTAFECGADDFVLTPFDPLELVARLHSVTQRYQQGDFQALGTIIRSGDVELSIADLTLRQPGRAPVVLTPTEMRLLECLMRNVNIVISRETLVERTWGYDFIGDSNRVDVYIRRIRKKLERVAAQPEYLHTVRGLGYIFKPPTMAGAIVDLELGNETPARVSA